MLYRSNSKEAEVLGKNIENYAKCMGAFEMMGRSILKTHGIDERPDPEKWYNEQQFLNSLKEIASKTGPHTLGLIGAKLAENAKFPPAVDSFEKALNAMDAAYRATHRGDTKSYKKVTRIGENSYRVVICNPTPCEIDPGYLKSLAARFGVRARISHDDSCKNKGAEICSYTISW